ncbi:MAG: hypothetical protein KDB00_29285, partial [Planctomycetales bacterium]|nr:hypothetical protein [Planctomycetales bacterium]
MRWVAVCGFVLIYVTGGSWVIGQAPIDPETIARVYNERHSLVAVVISENDQSITLEDLSTGREVTVKKSADLKIDKPLSLDETARHVGLAKVVGWKINQLSDQASHRGKIIRVAQQTVYLNLGRNEGVRVGQPLFAYKNEGMIVDPDSGAELGIDRRKIAELSIIEVNDDYSKAKLMSELETDLEFGDEVRTASSPMVVGVCSIRDTDGTTTSAGATVAEEITTALVRRRVPIMERSVMDAVLSE